MGKGIFMPKQNNYRIVVKKNELTAMHRRLTLYKPATNLL